MAESANTKPPIPPHYHFGSWPALETVDIAFSLVVNCGLLTFEYDILLM